MRFLRLIRSTSSSTAAAASSGRASRAASAVEPNTDQARTTPVVRVCTPRNEVAP